jgi:membrane protein YqaA with SNARE-associated domain
LSGYLVVALVVIGVNLLPAFGPPTWAVLVLFELHSHLRPVPLVIVGASAAAAGRFTLASAAAKFGDRLPVRYRERLLGVRTRLMKRRAGAIAGLVLFALSPLPSGQLFVAAGLLDVALIPVTLAFFAGRIASYAGYVTAATLANRSYGDVAIAALRSPWAIAGQVALLALVTVAPLVDWSGVRKRLRPRGGER